MELQVGDKILCIKGRTFFSNIYAIKGRIYTIREISTSVILVNCELGNINAALYRRFAKCEKDHEDFHIFTDHFISLKESRKLKLKKLSMID